MTVETFSWACSLLSKMPSSIPWSKDQAELYEAGLQALPDFLVSDVLHRAIHNCDERPSVATLVRMAGEILDGPTPSAAAAWDEVEALLITRGLYCDPDPFKTNIYREGEPHFSHPLVGRAVKLMGGWRTICTSEAGIDYLRNRFQVSTMTWWSAPPGTRRPSDSWIMSRTLPDDGVDVSPWE